MFFKNGTTDCVKFVLSPKIKRKFRLGYFLICYMAYMQNVLSDLISEQENI
jgi:hypothetical protein